MPVDPRLPANFVEEALEQARKKHKEHATIVVEELMEFPELGFVAFCFAGPTSNDLPLEIFERDWQDARRNIVRQLRGMN